MCKNLYQNESTILGMILSVNLMNTDNEKRVLQRETFHRFYLSRPWRLIRIQKLNNDPLCEECLKQNLTQPAEHVHHITSLSVDYSLRLSYPNLLSVCIPCHSKFTADEQRIKRGGVGIATNMQDLEDMIG